MLESLLPLFQLYFTPAPPAPRMVPPHEHPVMMEIYRPDPRQVQKPDPVVERAKEKIWRERPVQVRRKGYQESSENYGAKRMQHAVDSMHPDFSSLEYTQRTHRGMVRSMRRLERSDRNFPRGCEFPCTEQE